MVKKGSTVVIHTKDAIYSPCQVVSINDRNVVVQYYAGMKKNRSTGEFFEDCPMETIPLQKIFYMSERF